MDHFGSSASSMPMAGSVTPASYLPSGQEVPPPSGFIGFCLRHEADCEGGTDKPSDLPLTPGRWTELNTVNDFVNRQPQVSDLAHYGVAEYWTYADARGGGDCEDLALEKRRLLVSQGWPADALLIATVREWNGDGHAVLLVETAAGEFVLDNKNWRIVPAAETPYIWRARQSRQRPYVWVNLDRGSFRQLATALPPLGAPVPFIEAVRTASIARHTAIRID
ncbi:MAG TPA: transglutaminase-like cysteine peptidase [Parvibaculum sp.]